MVKFLTGNYRRPTNFVRQRISSRNIQGLDCSGNIDDELWLLLEYYSEAQEVGLGFLKKIGIHNAAQRKKIYHHFQANIRQAKSFYYAAKTLPSRSSSLPYFYCFENLARAALAVYKPLASSFKKEQHGLTCEAGKNINFQHETVVTKKNGVFPKFYNWYFGAQIKPQSLNVTNLMSYCTDISYQCNLASIGTPKILYLYSAILSDDQRKTTWALLGIPKVLLILKYPKSFKNFLSGFEEINLPWKDCERIFDVGAPEQNALKFFQSTQETPWIGNLPNDIAVRMQILKVFENSFQTNYFDNKFDFIVSLPYTQRNQLRMDEIVAIYLIMFYLSTLVRYKPQYLEKLLSKKEAWLIDSFVRSCTVTFLRGMVSRIIDTDFVLKSR